ncbi:hypothetical protein [Burkholderia alba]|uniref:hypothetical protein n=1 Tax=Burkholderia alba TaxID=2683677 RepID=UPI002B057497|nr:hypothetical protein [Burkholderia alba]
MNIDTVVSSLGTINTAIAVATGVCAVIMFFKNYRSGSQIFSQSRTKRLYEIMKLKDRDWRAISSGALQLAVKEAFGVQLSGDEIRFVFERDDALSLFRSIKYAGRFVKFNPDEVCYEDNRFEWLRRFTLVQNFKFFLVASLVVYFATFLAIPKNGVITPILATILMLFGAGTTFVLMFLARGAESASTLLNVNEKYPLPAYGYDSESRLGKKHTAKLSDRTRHDATKQPVLASRRATRPLRRSIRSTRKIRSATI